MRSPIELDDKLRNDLCIAVYIGVIILGVVLYVTY